MLPMTANGRPSGRHDTIPEFQIERTESPRLPAARTAAIQVRGIRESVLLGRGDAPKCLAVGDLLEEVL